MVDVYIKIKKMKNIKIKKTLISPIILIFYYNFSLGLSRVEKKIKG